jgi:hypothetical protein
MFSAYNEIAENLNSNVLSVQVHRAIRFKYKSLEEIQARAEKKKKDEEVLTPLTDEERALDPRNIVANQPDFVADLTFFYGEGFGGMSGGEHIARKGKRYREESQFWLFIGEEGKPAARVSTEVKAYDDMEPARDERAMAARSIPEPWQKSRT